MGLLADTIHDARRPLPRGAAWVRRSALDEAPPEPEDTGDPAALTVFRLQKDGGPQPPVAPVREPGMAARTGPSSGLRGAPVNAAPAGPAHVSPEPRTVPMPETRRESKQSESRFAATEAPGSKAFVRPIPSPERVDRSFPPTITSPSGSTVDSQSQASRPTEDRHQRSRVARGAPSEDLLPAATPAGAGAPPVADSARASAPQPALASLPAAAAAPARHAPLEAQPMEAAGVVHAVVPLTARADRRAGTQPLASGPLPRRGVTTVAPAAQPPSLRIGRIDVTVLADPAPKAAPAAPAADPHFLSRHYLRRT